MNEGKEYSACEGVHGESAFYTIVGWKTGQFREVRAKSFPQPNIFSHTMELIMKAASNKDEAAWQHLPKSDRHYAVHCAVQ